jgi:hypothetical protein
MSGETVTYLEDQFGPNGERLGSSGAANISPEEAERRLAEAPEGSNPRILGRGINKLVRDTINEIADQHR